MPADLALTISEDANVHVGIPYTRAAEFRTVYHFSDHFQWGVCAAESCSSSSALAKSSSRYAFNAALGPQFDARRYDGAPNVFPDIHTKMAWDDRCRTVDALPL